MSRVSFWFWIDLDRSRSSNHRYLSQNEGFWGKMEHIFSNICSHRIPFKVWGCPGGSWGRSWSHLGSQGHSGQQNLVRLCTPRLTQEVQNRAKIIKKLNENSYDFWLHFQNDFSWIWVPFFIQKALQNERCQGRIFDFVANMRKVWFWMILHRFCYIFQLWKHRFST